MAIRLSCHCGAKLRVKDESAGKRIRCPKCQAYLAVPKTEQTTLTDSLLEDEAFAALSALPDRPKPSYEQVVAERKRQEEQKRNEQETRKLAESNTRVHESTPKSPAEKTALLQKLMEELTGFMGMGATRRSAIQITLKNREDLLDRLDYYRGWISEGTFPKVTLYVLDAITTEVRFPHLILLTGPLNENIAFLSDKAYEARVKKYVSKGRIEMADSYQDFDMPGFTNAKRLNLDFSRKILEPGYYSVSLVLKPGDNPTASSSISAR